MVTLDDVGQALCGMLREGRDVERCAAAQALGGIRHANAIDALIEGLHDEDEDVRVDAVGALNVIAHPRAGAALLESLVRDPVGEIKVASATALGRLKEAEAIPVLRELVRGREGHVLWDEEEFLDGGWDDWLDVQVQAIEALGEMGAVEAVSDIVAAIEDEMGQDLGPVAFRSLARLGQGGLAALAAALRSGAERRRRHAAEALRENGSRAACETLLIALGDRCADIRGTVLSALAARDPGDGRLETFLADPDPDVRAAAVRLVGRHWPERLDALLDDPGEQVQAEVIALLSADGTLARPKDFAFRLRVKMRGPSARVAATACETIAEVAPENALADLCEQLADRKCPAEVRRAAARALARLGSVEAVEALSAALGDDRREVLTESLAALARVARSGPDAEAARDVLVRALGGELVPAPEEAKRPDTAMVEEGEASPPPEPEDGAAAAVEEGWPTTTLQAITGGVAEPGTASTNSQMAELDEVDAEFLALAETRPRKKHVPVDLPMVPHRDVRRLAAHVLGDVAQAEVATALAAVLDDDDLGLRRRAADSLARLSSDLGGLPSPVRDALLGAVEDRDRDFRLAVTRALGTTSLDAVAALTGRLGDSDSFVRAAAAQALAALGAAPRELHDLLSDEQPGVRLAAAVAIARQGGADALAPLVELVLSHEGMHTAEVASLLRRLDRRSANERFLATLRDPDQRWKWRIAIDALRELNRPGGEPAPRMVA